MKFRIEAACCSHVGKVRANNEDNYYFSDQIAEANAPAVRPALYQIFEYEPVCFGVFDGMGGQNDGEVAALMAAKAFENDCRRLIEGNMLSEHFFCSSILHMNDMVCASAESQRSNMGSTAVIAGFSEETVYIANMGDSRAYRFRNGKLLQLSQDHVEEIPPFMRHSRRKKPRLTQCLGISAEEMVLEPYVGRGSAIQGDFYLLCSDGLTDMLTDEQIASILACCDSVPVCAQKLIDTALTAGGIDNTTLILVKLL